MKPRALVALAVAVLASPLPAAADRPASSGLYAEAGIGGAGFLGEAASYSKLGPAFSLRVGYDLFSWLSVGGHLAASTHEATVPPPPEGELYQLYTVAGDARLGFRVGRVAAYAQGGAGLGIISSNVLDKVGLVEPDERVTLIFAAGGGLEYQLQNRHYALGLSADWTLFPSFDAAQTLTARGYLRYTY